MVDAAVGLQNLGHEVTIYTSHCDKSHCFEEVKDGTLKVIVSGDTVFPVKVFGNRFAILCAILRQFHLAYNLIRSDQGKDYDVFIVDQLSACIPIIQDSWWNGLKGKIVFYCHFPDQLLATREGMTKVLYRLPFDLYEHWTTGLADVIVVNSNFTKLMFHQTFKRIKRDPTVIYPCAPTNTATSGKRDSAKLAKEIPALEGVKYILSINRFERKKNIEFAIDSFVLQLKDQAKTKTNCKLVIAGGYDKNVTENVAYLLELHKKCFDCGFEPAAVFPGQSLADIPSSAPIIFLPSVSTSVKNLLLENCLLLLYTPAFEHFGIVPLEAMLACRPVLAVNNGGPLETVVDGVTGWTRPQDSKQWNEVIHKVLGMRESELDTMGQKGRERVLSNFTEGKMAKEFEVACEQARKSKRESGIWTWIIIAVIFTIILQVVSYVAIKYLYPTSVISD